MTTFGGVTTTDHRGFHLDLSYDKVMKEKVIDDSSPFNRKLQSKCPTSVRFYKHYLENKGRTQRLDLKVQVLLDITQQRKLTSIKNNALNKVKNKSHQLC